MQQTQRNSQVISFSLQPAEYKILQKLSKTSGKTTSAVIAELIREKERSDAWEDMFMMGREIAEKFNIKSEEDVLKIIDD
jgi:hypothetical protein